MNPLPDDAQAHLSAGVLRAWLVGQLSDAETERVEVHLETCDTCARRLDTLNMGHDPFVQRLRDAAGVAPNAPGRSVATTAKPAALADANLMFAALALQAGVIDAPRLAEACLLWAAGGGGAMADLLTDKGWLDDEARRSIEQLLAARARQRRGAPAAETLRLADPGGRGWADTVAVSSLTDDRFRLTTLHSTGGIGQVWRAQDELLGREVALKELLPELRGSVMHRERFYREARVAAQLSHPGTVPVYEYREEGGRCYYTMKFLAGRTYAEAVREAHAHEGVAPFERMFPLLEQFVAVCDAVAYAHSLGVVHRDLKGDNIVVGEFGEVTVIDWGLARPIAGATGPIAQDRLRRGEAATIHGERLGTPGYMAPEQARGDLDAIDERTDVYGLAAVLYEALTARPPFAGATANETMHLAETADPAPPSVWWPDAPAELAAICLRGLAKRKEDRFPTATDLRDAVRTWVASQAERRRDAEQQAEFFSLSSDLFVTLDAAGFITHVNPAYRRLFGYADGEPEGTHYSQTLHGDDRRRAAAVFETVQAGHPKQDLLLRVARKDGGYEQVSWSVTRGLHPPVLYAIGRAMDAESLRQRSLEARGRFFSLSPDLFVISDEQGLAAQINDAWRDVLGLEPDEVVGHPFTNVMHPEDVPAATRAGRRALLRESVVNLRTRVRHGEGGYRTIAWTLCRVPGERVNYAIGRDVTGQADAEQLLSAIVDTLPEALLVIGAPGRIAHANAATERLFGYKPGELIGQSVGTLVPAEGESGAESGLVAALARSPSASPERTGRVEGVTKDGRPLAIEGWLHPLRGSEEAFSLATLRPVETSE